MKPLALIIAIVTGLAVGFWTGSFHARQQAWAAVLSGPYSDNYVPALSAIADAKAKLQSGETNVMEQLQTAETQIKAAQEWSEHFLGQTPDNIR